MTRIAAMSGLIDRCEVFADVGCDHGKLCKAVIEEGKAKTVIASDISKDSLNKARKLLAEYDNVKFIQCDGLDAGRLRADCIAICGMGGLTIIKILECLPQSTLILGPQDHAAELRKFLCGNRYFIEKDFVVKEGKRYYDLIKAKPGEQNLDERQIEFGAYCYDGQPMLIEKLNKLCEKIKTYPLTKENQKKIKMITELINW